MLAQLIQQHVGAPEEHAGIPEEIAGFDVASGLGQFGLFVETAHGQGFGASRGAAAGEFDVAVAGLGPARLDAEHHQVARGGGLEGRLDDGAVLRDLADHVVGGEHAHHRVGVERVQDVRGQADGGRRVALRGLGQDLCWGTSGSCLTMMSRR